MENEKELIKLLKNNLYRSLNNIGIPENSVTVKLLKKNPKNYLGVYRSGSAFRSRPILLVDHEIHARILIEEHGDIDFKKEENKKWLMDEMNTTLLHEYGHAIEDMVGFLNRANLGFSSEVIAEIKDVNATLNNEFNDMEDFAEMFAMFVSGQEWQNEEKIQSLTKIMNFYKKHTFNEPCENDLKENKAMKL